MVDYTVTYTETENKAMEYIAFSVDDWIQNATHERARIAIDEIVQIGVQKCLENNIQIPSSREGIVDLAFEEGWVKKAADRTTDMPIVG